MAQPPRIVRGVSGAETPPALQAARPVAAKPIPTPESIGVGARAAAPGRVQAPTPESLGIATR
jgi:hypothetical protein